jgi:hypothetical protein
MKCFLHLDYDPLPREASGPDEAFRIAESVLGDDEDDPSSTWRTFWRRDDLYPDNYVRYSHDELEGELKISGAVVLQRVSSSGERGPSVEIFTDDLERRNDEEADEALHLTMVNLGRCRRQKTA